MYSSDDLSSYDLFRYVDSHENIILDLDNILGKVTVGALKYKFFKSAIDYLQSPSKENFSNFMNLLKIGVNSIGYFFGEDENKLVEGLYKYKNDNIYSGIELPNYLFPSSEKFLRYLKREHNIKVVSITLDNGTLKKYFNDMGIEFISNDCHSNKINDSNKIKIANERNDKILFISGPEDGKSSESTDHMIVVPNLSYKIRVTRNLRKNKNRKDVRVVSQRLWMDTIDKFAEFYDI